MRQGFYLYWRMAQVFPLWVLWFDMILGLSLFGGAFFFVLAYSGEVYTMPIVGVPCAGGTNHFRESER